MRKQAYGEGIHGKLRLKIATLMALFPTSHNVFYGKTSRDAYYFYV